jgi:hypothetical protein
MRNVGDIHPGRLTFLKFARNLPKLNSYTAVRDFIESERPEWLRKLMPRIISAPSEYWPQKILAVAAILSALCNQLAKELGKKSDQTAAAVEGQMGHLLQFDVPTYYVSKELLAAAARTELPTEMSLDAVPFPFPALVFVLPKGMIRHQSAGDCPYIIVSRPEKGQVFDLPLRDITIGMVAPETIVLVSTYLPGENRSYHFSINVVCGETMRAAFERASAVPFEISGKDMYGFNEIPSFSDADFVSRLWLLGMTLLLIMASGAPLIETGRLLKVVKPKNLTDAPKEFWSPNFLGRVYQSRTEADETGQHLRPHWRKGHIKSQPHGPQHSLRKVIWIQPYRTGDGDKS